jgi:hypothetical protein
VVDWKVMDLPVNPDLIFLEALPTSNATFGAGLMYREASVTVDVRGGAPS